MNEIENEMAESRTTANGDDEEAIKKQQNIDGDMHCPCDH